MNKKTLAFSILATATTLINLEIKTMQKDKTLQEIKAESALLLNKSRSKPEITGLAQTIINDVGINTVIGSTNFYATSDDVKKIVNCWCKVNPSGCEDMQKLMPYALRYQAAKEIEKMQKRAEYTHWLSERENS